MELGDLVLTGNETGQALANASAGFPGQPGQGGVDFTTLLASVLGSGLEPAAIALPLVPMEVEGTSTSDQEAVAAALLGGLLYCDGMGVQIDLSMTVNADGTLTPRTPAEEYAGLPSDVSLDLSRNTAEDLLEGLMPFARPAARPAQGASTAPPTAAEIVANAAVPVAAVPSKTESKGSAFAELLKVGPGLVNDAAARVATVPLPIATAPDNAREAKSATPDVAASAQKRTGASPAIFANAALAPATPAPLQSWRATDTPVLALSAVGERETGGDRESIDGVGVERNTAQNRVPEDASRSVSATRTAGDSSVVDMRKDGAEKLGEVLASQALRGGGRVKVRLQPPDLGELQVEVLVRGKNVSIRFEVENGSAQQVLAREMPNLKDALTGRGFSVDRAEVYLQGGSQQSFAQRSPMWGMSGGSLADGEGDDGDAREESPRAGRVDIEV